MTSYMYVTWGVLGAWHCATFLLDPRLPNFVHKMAPYRSRKIREQSFFTVLLTPTGNQENQMSGKITGDVVSVEGTYLSNFCCKYYYNSRHIREKHTTLYGTVTLAPSCTPQQHTAEKNPNTRLWETN